MAQSIQSPYIVKSAQSLGNFLSKLLEKGGTLEKAATAPSTLGDLLGTAGQFGLGPLGGMGGRALGYTLSDLINKGSGTGWLTPDSVASFLPGLVGFIDPKAGKISQAAFSGGNVLSQMLAGKSLPSLIGGQLGLGGGGGAALAFPSAAALTEAGASGAGAAGAGGLAALTPFMGPLAIVGAMLAAFNLINQDRRSPWEAYKQKIYTSLDYLNQYAKDKDSMAAPQKTFVENKLSKALNGGEGFYGLWGGTKLKGLEDFMTANNASSLADVQKVAETDPEVKNWLNVMTKRMEKEAPMTKLLFGENDPYSILSSGGSITPDTWKTLNSKYKNNFLQPAEYIEPLS